MKPVLITGANGFTGRILVDVLLNSGMDVIPMVQQGRSCGLENEVEADFCSNDFPSILHRCPPVSAVVHLGTRVGWDGSKREDLFKPNVLATAELVEWAKQNDSYFIFASAALIAGTGTTYITPETGWELNSDNHYLYSKWLAEHVIAMSGIRHVNLRISGIFGAGGPSHLGINNAINGALKGVAPVQVGDGKIRRNYIYVKDLCNVIRYCLENQPQGTLLTAGHHRDSIAQMLGTICNVLLPGTQPEVKPGSNGHDQIVEPSTLLPGTRTFEEAINDIKINEIK